MQKERVVLIVEDNELNREILSIILEDTYRVLEAKNGKEGLDVVREYGKKISLILLDLEMPVMSGYEFLSVIQSEGIYTDIPIIVTTGSNTLDDEIACLEGGASDFVTKPYNPDIVKRRVSSMIRLRETSAMLNRVEKDTLTGVYSKEFFYEYVDRALKADAQSYDLVCYDVAAFRLINEKFGIERGNEVLCYLVTLLQESLPSQAICGRIGTDVFAVLSPHKEFSEHEVNLKRIREAMIKGPVMNVVVKAGIYLEVDPHLPIPVICDNAMMAVEDIRSKYGCYLAKYDIAIREKRNTEQEIVDNMEDALNERQFQVYFQAKHNLHTDMTDGAEALVRWIHPKRGFMNPGVFIPLFERNGFIYKLDLYMLERVCEIQREWLDRGFTPISVSVNLSRVDFDVPEFDDICTKIVDSYQIPHPLIHFEILESCYAADPQKMRTVVNGFRDRGFKVELDDFGAGYSSLNVLSELTLDVLKLDMSLVRNMFEEKHRCVLEHVLSIAHNLNIKVVAEGVETKEQADALRTMGADHEAIYAQGFYYARPVPKDAFEQYLREKASV